MAGCERSDEPPRIEEGDAVRDPGHLVKVMARDEDAGALGGSPQQRLPKQDDPAGVEGVRGLVENDEPRAVQEDRGEAEPLAVSE